LELCLLIHNLLHCSFQSIQISLDSEYWYLSFLFPSFGHPSKRSFGSVPGSLYSLFQPKGMLSLFGFKSHRPVLISKTAIRSEKKRFNSLEINSISRALLFVRTNGLLKISSFSSYAASRACCSLKTIILSLIRSFRISEAMWLFTAFFKTRIEG